MNYYYYNQNNSDYPYISSPNNNLVKKENPFHQNVIERELNKQNVLDSNNLSPEKEDSSQLKSENENFGTGKFRFINTQADKINKRSEYNNDKSSYSTQDINSNKDNNNDLNKITNNICIIINKPEVKDINNNNNNSKYINSYNEEEENNINMNNKKKLNKEEKIFIFHKKNKSSTSSNKHTFRKSPNDYIEEIDNYNNYSYMETEPNKTKITLHKRLKQKKQQFKILQQTIEKKENTLKGKRLKVNDKEKKVIRSTTFDRGTFNRKLNDLKGESASYDSSDYYTIERKKKPYKTHQNSKKNLNTNLQNKILNSENRVFSDTPLIDAQKQKYIDDEEDNLYNTMSPNATRDKYNISFNQSIEQKRRLLGIPLYKNEFPNYNIKRIKNNIFKEEKKRNNHINMEESKKDNIDKEQKKNLEKIKLYKKRQDEILKNYEKKKILNQRSRDNIKSKNKSPIKNNYYEKQNKGISSNNIFDNDNNINGNNNNKKQGRNDMKANKSYVVRQSELKNKIKQNSNNPKDFPNNNKTNKINNINYTINHKDDVNHYLKSKIKVYKQKEKPKEKKKKRNNNNNNFIIKDINRKSQDINELRPSPSTYNEPEPPKDLKIYENKSYYSKLMSKLFNYNDFESQNKYSKISSNNNSDNKSINNINNTKNTSNKNSNLNINNYNKVSPYNSKLLYASPRHREIMTIQDDENGKVLRVVKKRYKSPIKKQVETQETQLPKKTHIHNQIKFIEIKKPEKREERQENTIQKKDYTNNINAPGRGILALRRINQRIENFKKNIRIPSKKRKKAKSKNPQYKSLSQIKKIGKHPFGKIKQSKSIKTLPDADKETYKNFDFINDL